MTILDATTPLPLGSIHSYHAHVYFDGPDQRHSAEILREQMATRFEVSLGGWHDRAVGPHTRPMYLVAFPKSEFPRLVPWLMINRRGLSVLVHPNTGRPQADHQRHAMWLGAVLHLHTDHLPHREELVYDYAPNTRPTEQA